MKIEKITGREIRLSAERILHFLKGYSSWNILRPMTSHLCLIFISTGCMAP